MKDSDVRTILDACLKNSGYTYSILDKVIVIRKAELQQQEQIKKIRGTVTDKKKAPLPGVTVLIKGTSIGVATDMNGKFEMIQPKDSNIVLIISFIGMKTITIPYKGQDLTVVMEEDSQEMDEVVVTGYQVGRPPKKHKCRHFRKNGGYNDSRGIIGRPNVAGTNPRHDVHEQLWRSRMLFPNYEYAELPR